MNIFTKEFDDEIQYDIYYFIIKLTFLMDIGMHAYCK
jgi:hypothetical protein